MNNFVLEKRTSEMIAYDIDCTNILDPDEIIVLIESITSDQEGLEFSGQAINVAPVVFPDGVIAEIGKVISVYIADGIIPAQQVNQLYTIRALFNTSKNNTREATVLLNVTNIPVQTGRVC